MPQNRKRALRKDEAQTLLDLIPDPAWIYDLETLRIVAVNAAASEHYGYSREEFLQKSIFELGPAEDAQKVRDFISAMDESRRSQTRWRHLRADGSLIRVDIIASPLSVDGRMARLVLAKDVTGKEELLEALQEQKTLFSVAERLGSLGSWDYDIAADRLIWSPGACEIFGVTSKTFLGTYEAFLTFVHPEDRPRVAKTIADADRSGRVIDHEYRAVRPDGAVRFIHERGRVVTDESGRPARRIGIITDVTEERQTRQRLEQSQALLKLAGEIGKFGGWTIDIADQSVHWSNEVYAIYELPEGTRVSFDEGISFFTAEDREKALSVTSSCVEMGEPFDVELQIVSTTGVRKWVRSIGRPVFGDSGKVVRIEGAFQDITEKKNAERSLIRSHQWFRKLADSMPQIVWTATPEGDVDYANRRFYEYLSEPDTDFPIENWLDAVHPDDTSRCVAAWSKAVASGTDYAIEMRVRRGDGVYRWHFVTARPVFDESGAVEKWFGAGLDIHDRKVAEEIAAEAARRLERTLEGLSDGFCTLDREWRITFVNGAAEAITRWNRADLIGAEIWRVFPDLAGTEVEKQLRNAARSKRPVLFQFHLDARKASYEVSADPSEDGMTVSVRDITERRQAEAQLRLLEASVTNLNDMVLITSAETLSGEGPKIVFANEAFLKHTGFSREEVIGKTPRILQGRGTQRSRLDAIRNALEKAEPVRTELLNYKKSGEEFHNELSIVPVRDRENRLTHFVAIQRDITSRVAAEARLQQSEARFRAVAQATADVIWDWDLKNDSIWWNDGYSRNFGHPVTSEAMPVDSWTDYIHPDDYGRVMRKVEKAIKNRQSEWEDEYRFLNANGESVPVLDRGYLLLDNEGKPDHFVGGMLNLDQRDAARAVLQRNAQRLTAHIAQIRALTRNPGATESTLMTRIMRAAQILAGSDGAAIATMQGDSLVYEFACGMATGNKGFRVGLDSSLSGEAFKTGKTILCSDAETDGRADALAVRKIGSRSTVVTVLPGREKPAGVLIVVSQRQGAFTEEDANFISLFAQSAGAVLERRAIEGRLNQSQRLEAIGHLTGGIAHDFNNLLTVILGNAETFAKELSGDDALSPLAEMTKAAAERGSELTSRLLAFARQQPLDPAATDVNRLISSMDVMMRRTLGEHIEIEIVRGGGLWPAMIDPAQLESAILNLAINARDAMPGGGKLTIETANTHLSGDYAEGEDEVMPGQYVMIAVSDTGAGMTEDVLARAFEPFFTTKGADKGTGLGLSMVFGFVKQSKGHVKIYSEPGAGTTVKLYLPKSSADAGDRALYGQGDIVGGGEKILLVEDDDLVRAYVLSQLRKLGYKVIEARNAREALEALHQISDIELLFTDIFMPGGMSGKELSEEAVKLRPALKVLFTSGYTENAIVHHGRLDAGVNFISKPYRQADLDKKIRSVLSKS